MRDEEGELLRAMIDASHLRPNAPLGLYIGHLNARLNLTMTRSRRFRRSDVKNVVFEKRGEDLRNAEWYVDLQPGT